MTVSGSPLGHGVARSDAGRMVPYLITEPLKSAANLAVIAAEGARWRRLAEGYWRLALAGGLPVAVALRAAFADSALAVAAENIRLGVCCNVLAATPDGRVLGVMVYHLLSPSEGAIGLLAIDPASLAGAGAPEAVRGVGTALVAAASRRFLAAGVQTVYIHPFDQEAARFWAARGLVACGGGGIMCLRGRRAIEELLGTCATSPECAGDCVICGLAVATEGARAPALRAWPAR